MLGLPHASAATPPVLITSVQTGSSVTANAEYVRLTNVSSASVDVSGWKLQYKAAAGTSWTTRATLQGTMKSKGVILLATKEFVTTEVYQPLNSGLAATGGHLQVVDKLGVRQDLLGWGTATAAHGTPAPAPAVDNPLNRKTDGKGVYINTGNNAADFTTSQPVATPSGVKQVASTQTPVKIQITELLPNPAAPLSDTNDEFVELFNPSNKTVALKDYKLLSGSNLKTAHTFQGETIPPNSYTVFTSGGTNLSLTNSGGKVQLLAPDGSVLSETAVYDTAKDNYSWSRSGDTWQWSTTATPGSANKAVAPPQKVLKSATKSSKAKSSGKTAASRSTTGIQEPEGTLLANQPNTVHPMALAIVGLGAIGYGAYEYRHDIKNRLHQFRANRMARRAIRQKT